MRAADEGVARQLAARLGLHRAVARTLAARGMGSPGDCDGFLDPRLAGLVDPFRLADMDRAVERALRAVEGKETIAVFGDYDVDGISATAIMVLALRELGASPRVFIPHRIHDGYGMSERRVRELAAAGVTLLITVDNGISAAPEVAVARACGMDVIVTDHHLAEGDLPDATAIVNPNRPDVAYPGARLCGAGVAFKFAHALLKNAGTDARRAKEFLRELLDLAALGTIADVVPLVGENRIIAAHGLTQLQKTRRVGLRALLESTGLRERSLTATHVGFIIGPRLNAAGRTEHALVALELLLTEDAGRAREIARYLEGLNTRRREEEGELLEDSLGRAEELIAAEQGHLLVVGGENFHLGIVGIVAARLAERYYRPAIVLRLDTEVARGSARSIPGFDIHHALTACDSHLLGYGGHAAAAGLQLAPRSVPAFRDEINSFAADIFRTRDLTPELSIDAQLARDEVNWTLLEDMERLQPFGESNPEPVFLIEGVRSSAPPRIVGERHLKLQVRVGNNTFSAIGFRLAESRGVCESLDAPYDIACRPTRNTWRGRTKLELEFVDVRPTGDNRSAA